MSLPPSFRQLNGRKPSTVSASNKASALLIIDAQNSYNAEPLKISHIDQTQRAIAAAVAKYRKGGAPIVWIQHSAGSASPVFNPDTEGFDFIGDVRPQAGETVIVKKFPSSFTQTELDETLKKHKVDQIVLTGYMAHVCVTGTARSGMEAGYDVCLLRDAIGDRDIPSVDGKRTVTAQQLVETVCDELGDAVGTVLTVADVA